MLHDTPLRKRHEALSLGLPTAPGGARDDAHRPGAATGSREPVPAVEYLAYGPPDETGHATCEVPATFGSVEVEYAALRRAAGLVDGPNRGTLVITGADRRDFLDRMVTQNLKTFGAGVVAQSFWLNRKGRIAADLLLVETADRLWVDVDVHQAAETARTLGDYVFTEDVEIADRSSDVHRISVHGPEALDAVGLGLEPLTAGVVTIAGVEVVAARRDQVGGAGVELFVPHADAVLVWDALVASGDRVRPVGWFAWNIARIEGGTPLFNVDFGASNLPHETGVLRDRVSFEKGCYLGQEVVARIESLGKPKQRLVGLRPSRDLLPVAGAQVLVEGAATMDDPVGVVTSSTLSPMLGAKPIAFAMMRMAESEPGTTVIVNAEGEQVEATVTGLTFLER